MEKFDHTVAYGFILHEKKAWFYNYTYGAIFELDLNSHTIELLWKDEDVSFWLKNQYGGGVWHNNKLYFAPREANRILVYDLLEKSVSYIDFDYTLVNNKQFHNKFVDAIEYNDCIYFFPGRFKAIVKLDTRSFQISFISDWIDMIGGQGDASKVYFSVVKHIGGGIFMLPCWQLNAYIQFDANKEQCEIQAIGEGEISDLLFVDNEIWIANKNEPYIDIYSKDLILKKHINVNCNAAMGKGGCRHIFEVNNRIFVIPFCGDAMIEICNHGEYINKVFQFPTSFTEYMWEVSRVDKNTFALEISDDRAIIYECRKGEILHIDGNNDPCIFNTWLNGKSSIEIESNAKRICIKELQIEGRGLQIDEFIHLV